MEHHGNPDGIMIDLGTFKQALAIDKPFRNQPIVPCGTIRSFKHASRPGEKILEEACFSIYH